MTREEAIKIIQNEYKCVNRECDIERSCGKCPYMIPTKEPILQAYEMAIKALSQEPCDDAISREDAIAEINDTIALYMPYLVQDGRTAKIPLELTKAIMRVPPVTQKSGKWIRKHDSIVNAWFWECNKCECGFQHEYNFCPNCGAKMESEDKE